MRTKKQNIIIVVALICIVTILGYFFVDIKSVDEFKKSSASKDETCTVTISIACNTILDNYDKLEENLRDEKYVPKDGIILAKEEVQIGNKDTVFDALLKVVKKHDIQMEYSGSEKNGTQYIRGINYLYEFSCGKLSGWMYKVNDVFPSYGCGQYKLKEGDNIEFVYTCDLGRDVGDDYLEKAGSEKEEE